MKTLASYANVGIAETCLCDVGVDVKTADQSGDWLKFREDETAYLEPYGCK